MMHTVSRIGGTVLAVALVIVLVVLATTPYAAYVAHRRVLLTCSCRATPQDLCDRMDVGDMVMWSLPGKECALSTVAINSATATTFYHASIVVRLPDSASASPNGLESSSGSGSGSGSSSSSGSSRPMNSGRKVLLHYVNPDYWDFFMPASICGGPAGDERSLNPCVSDARSMLEQYARRRGHVLVAPYQGGASSEEIVSMAMRMSCGMPYDRHFVTTFLLDLLRRHKTSDLRALHCNTFVGLLLEALGELKPSSQPVRDYVPGRLLRLLAAEPSNHYPGEKVYCCEVAPQGGL